MKTHPETANGKVAVAPAQNQTSLRSGIRILLVDDDLYVRKLNAGVLIRSGYIVETADDGADAWRALNEQIYDLVITDNKMPRVTGLELIKKLRSVDRKMPVILASGLPPVDEWFRVPGLRIQAVVTKPCPLTVLLETVRKVLCQAAEPVICPDAGPGADQLG